MARFRAAAVCALALTFLTSCLVHGVGHHMICKSVESVFDDGDIRPVHQSGRTLQGPAGKRGMKGEKGSCEQFDHQILANVIQERVNTATEGMTRRIEQLEEEIREMNSTAFMREKIATNSLEDQIESLQQQILQVNSSMQNAEMQITCNEGVAYQGKCYYAIIQSVKFNERNAVCNTQGGGVGSILNLEHQTLVENYVRSKMVSNTHIWLGMTYDHRRQTLSTAYGQQFPQSSVRWYPGYPNGNPDVLLQLLMSASTPQGVYNLQASDTTTAMAVLCEK